MALQLQDVITAARDRHPAFFKTRVTNAVLARYLTDYQNELLAKCLQRDAQFLKQTAAILLAFGGTSAPGAVGAATGDGLPGVVTDAGGFAVLPQAAGSLVEALTDATDGANVLVAEGVVTSATATTLSRSAASWTVNAYATKLAVITQGTGIGQRRTILSNSATQLVISTGSDGLAWDTTPDTTSLFEIVDPFLTSSLGVGVVTDLPALVPQTGYLVRLDATGTPYIDYTAPLVANVEVGVPLPTAHAVIGGTVRYTDGDRGDLTLCTVRQRFAPPNWPAVYTQGQTVYFCGTAADWADVASIDIDYVPICPAFTALTDYFLLPDAARAALVSAAASFMAMRVDGMPDVSIDASKHTARAVSAEDDYLASLRLSRRARSIRIRPYEY